MEKILPSKKKKRKCVIVIDDDDNQKINRNTNNNIQLDTLIHTTHQSMNVIPSVSKHPQESLLIHSPIRKRQSSTNQNSHSPKLEQFSNVLYDYRITLGNPSIPGKSHHIHSEDGQSTSHHEVSNMEFSDHQISDAIISPSINETTHFPISFGSQNIRRNIPNSLIDKKDMSHPGMVLSKREIDDEESNGESDISGELHSTSPRTDDLLADEDWSRHLDKLTFRKETIDMSTSLDSTLPSHLKEMAEKTDLCVICTEYMRRDLQVTCCGHVFHSECLSRWLRACTEGGQTRVCPTCRVVQKSKPISLFLEFGEVKDEEKLSDDERSQIIRDTRISKLIAENQNLRKSNYILSKDKRKSSREIAELLGKNMRLKQKLRIYRQNLTSNAMDPSKNHDIASVSLVNGKNRLEQGIDRVGLINRNNNSFDNRNQKFLSSTSSNRIKREFPITRIPSIPTEAHRPTLPLYKETLEDSSPSMAYSLNSSSGTGKLDTSAPQTPSVYNMASKETEIHSKSQNQNPSYSTTSDRHTLVS